MCSYRDLPAWSSYSQEPRAISSICSCCLVKISSCADVSTSAARSMKQSNFSCCHRGAMSHLIALKMLDRIGHAFDFTRSGAASAYLAAYAAHQPFVCTEPLPANIVQGPNSEPALPWK